ncbi:hypothetical protein [Kutzneria buriramensis]|uniref:Uncharacterized protein n=1 Tax=Kutzneria buriramensis TaxID=1045776 RepID=A0A3E0HB03_9PSEU|nr:hypothetical protein [Kutzneria buriramensis]REH41215.1 hypothetical protein BCF44_112299 [Kutzneria buriramensis]
MATAKDDALPDELVLPARFDAPPPITHSRVPVWLRVVGALALVLVAGWLPLWLVLIGAAAALGATGVSLIRNDGNREPRRNELISLVAHREPQRRVYAQMRWYSPGGPAMPEISVAAEQGGHVDQLFGVPDGIDFGGLRVDGEPAPAILLGDVDHGRHGVLVLDGCEQVLPLSLPYQPKGRKFLRPRQFGHVFQAPGPTAPVLTGLRLRGKAGFATKWLQDGPDWTDVRLLPVRGDWTRVVLADPDEGTLLAHARLPWAARRLATRPLAALVAVRQKWRMDPEAPGNVEILLYGADWPAVVLTRVSGRLR